MHAHLHAVMGTMHPAGTGSSNPLSPVLGILENQRTKCLPVYMHKDIQASQNK